MQCADFRPLIEPLLRALGFLPRLGAEHHDECVDLRIASLDLLKMRIYELDRRQLTIADLRCHLLEREMVQHSSQCSGGGRVEWDSCPH